MQNKRDAQKALYKNGMQIVGALIIGVKPLDPIQRQAITETSHRPLFNVIPPKTAQTPAPPPKASTRSYYLQASGGSGGGSTVSGPIASPSKSVISKIVDLVFGL
jgi:nuclear pore complex protein Nup53